MRLVACSILIALCTSAHAADFNVGPYKLGMTNAQAAKYGLSECKQELSRIECKPTFDPSIKIRRASIAFDAKTKRVVEISAQITHFPFPNVPEEQMSAAIKRSGWTDADWYRMAQDMGALLRKSFALQPCPSKHIEFDDYTARKTESCYLLPDASREIMYGYNDTYSFSARHRTDPHITAYVRLRKGREAAGYVRRLKQKAKEQQEAAKLQAFQSGR